MPRVAELGQAQIVFPVAGPTLGHGCGIRPSIVQANSPSLSAFSVKAVRSGPASSRLLRHGPGFFPAKGAFSSATGPARTDSGGFMQNVTAPARRPINYGTRAKIGMIFPSANEIAEPQMTAMLPEGVSLHVTRLALDASNMRSMLEKLENAVSLVADAGVDQILFHCTAVSMSSVDVVAEIQQRVAAVTDIPVTITSNAVLAALRAFDATKIVLLALRQSDQRDGLRFFAHHNITVLRERGLELRRPGVRRRVPRAVVRRSGRHARSAGRCLLLSCTAVKSTDAVERSKPSSDARSSPATRSRCGAASATRQHHRRQTPRASAASSATIMPTLCSYCALRGGRAPELRGRGLRRCVRRGLAGGGC